MNPLGPNWLPAGNPGDSAVGGVVIFPVASGLARSARFYLEPVDEGEPA